MFEEGEALEGADSDVPVAEADARIGGRYRLGRQLASGGMGTVWQGWDERLHRTVAVKKLHVRPGLTETERAEVARLTAHGASASDAFLRVWSLKEARLKALGVGISGAGAAALCPP